MHRLDHKVLGVFPSVPDFSTRVVDRGTGRDAEEKVRAHPQLPPLDRL